jgi:hypothetical protein
VTASTARERSGPVNEIPFIALEWPDAAKKRETTLTAAREFLAETAEAVAPDLPAADLLSCLTRYRAHLAAVVAAGSAHAQLRADARLPRSARDGHGYQRG